jgi:16S rRNA (uracil1498-N3)-methyltransferase
VTRAFVPGELASTAVEVGQRVELDEEESRYLLKVRRVRPGESLELLDGRGHRWTATLALAGRRAQVEIVAIVHEPEEPPTRIVLLGLPEPAATLDALTAASELGATQIVLVRCERSQGHAPAAARIERVLRAAMRQCGRPSPPELLGQPPGDAWGLTDALGHRSELPGVFGEPRAAEQSRLHGANGLVGGLRLLVGPEGGLSASEIEAARAAGFRGLCLGPWILRTPTAVVALLARLGV